MGSKNLKSNSPGGVAAIHISSKKGIEKKLFRK